MNTKKYYNWGCRAVVERECKFSFAEGYFSASAFDIALFILSLCLVRWDAFSISGSRFPTGI